MRIFACKDVGVNFFQINFKTRSYDTRYKISFEQTTNLFLANECKSKINKVCQLYETTSNYFLLLQSEIHVTRLHVNLFATTILNSMQYFLHIKRNYLLVVLNIM